MVRARATAPVSSATRSAIMYESRAPDSRFHVVDLDPYGSAAPFIDGAVQSVVDGGMAGLDVLPGGHKAQGCCA